jgi:hypothetical protein
MKVRAVLAPSSIAKSVPPIGRKVNKDRHQHGNYGSDTFFSDVAKQIVAKPIVDQPQHRADESDQSLVYRREHKTLVLLD